MINDREKHLLLLFRQLKRNARRALLKTLRRYVINSRKKKNERRKKGQ